MSGFAPTDEALAARLAALDPAGYARTRNHLDGAVSRLSPYLTHGFLHVPEVIAALRQRVALPAHHRFVIELAWREYFHHLWARLDEGILAPLRPPPGQGYRATLPEDLLTASTGVPVIDAAVRTLYDTGYLHNHARLWLASYAVHLRKVDWRTGADWMIGHLLDGDLPSNHLSWQWVAGTLTGRPYLFDAGNVACFAPAWASPGTAIDRDLAGLQRIASGPEDVGPERRRPAPVAVPALTSVPPTLLQTAAPTPSAQVTLVHPWSLRAGGGHRLLVLLRDFHERWPWSARRWQFLAQRAQRLGLPILATSAAQLASCVAASEASATAADHPVYDAALAKVARVTPVPRQFANPEAPCRSFSAFWRRVGPGSPATSA